jgi:ADP-dependent NAD(P)H-hydrate dehydratase / NAD(P)H-hydrate epimerase
MATLPEGTLMRRAADGLARTCAALLGRVYGSRVVLLVGSGDNGGDALFAGASLARRGARVDALLLASRAHEAGLKALHRAGGRSIATRDRHPVDELIRAADLAVDGIVGIGGRGPLTEDSARLVEVVDASGPWRVAVDLPSGVDADTGHVEGAAFTADVTVTFGCLKPGVLISPGHTRSGVVELVDIGLTPLLKGEPAVRAVEVQDVAKTWPKPGPDDDKYTRGVLGVMAGSAEYTGAAVLCVGAALEAGAGMVRFVGDSDATSAVRARWPEAVTGEGRVQAWVVGPGLGTGPDSVERLRKALASDLPVLVDADGLTALARHQELVRGRDALTVLTPHDREYERFGAPVGDDRLGAARRLAADLGATVLLKGSTTIVAQPDGSAHVNPTGTSWLASAGTGDVLSGITGMLLAAGLGPTAPVLGAFLHGLAARIASEGGPVTAIDVAMALPSALATVLPAHGRIAG